MGEKVQQHTEESCKEEAEECDEEHEKEAYVRMLSLGVKVRGGST